MSEPGSPKRSLLSPLSVVFGARKRDDKPGRPPSPSAGRAPSPPPSGDPVPPPVSAAPVASSDDMAVEIDSGDSVQTIAPFLAANSAYLREEISAEVARQWLLAGGLPSGIIPHAVTGCITLHNFLLADGTRVAFCQYFFAVRGSSGEVLHMQLMEQPQQVQAPQLHTRDEVMAEGPAVPPSNSPQLQSPRAPKSYAVSANVSVIGKRNVSPALLRDHLNASAATMACLRDSEKPVWKGSDIAMRIYYLLKVHFVEIPGYKYEVGAPSHRWTGVIGGLSATHLLHIANECYTLMKDEPTLLHIKPPVYVVGDLHGNYKDFVYFAKSFGLWNSADFVPSKFLFLGDYVDRGPHSIETLAFVLALKCRYPDKIFLLRGNHECAEINGDEELYLSGSFKTQCKLLYGNKDGEELWRAFNRCFEMMPLAAVINKKIFCVHAGIPRYLARNPNSEILDVIASVQRPPCLTDDFVFDLLWSDPATPNEEKYIGMDGFPPGFGRNSRGPATCVFGKEAVRLFCERSGCSHMIRAHQSPKLGIDVAKNAQILTVFSSSHYCGGYNRAAAVLVYQGKLDIIVSNPDAPEPDIFIANEGDYRTT